MADIAAPLLELARLYDVQTSYWDVQGNLITPTTEGLVRVLQALGAPLRRPEDAADAVRARQRELWGRGIEPVLVAWDGQPPEVLLRVPVRDLDQPRRFTLQVEEGPTYSWSMRLADLPQADEAEVDGTRYSARRLGLIGPYPLGYHRLTVEGNGPPWQSVLISAPVRPAEPAGGRHGKTWGVFIPLYALHSKDSWGAGDFKDLEDLVAWAQSLGGGLAATLPLLAAFLDEPFEPSPYSPASRLFWNEFYLNLARVPEVQQSSEVQQILQSRELSDELRAERAQPLVDYRQQYAMKRHVLRACVRHLVAGSSPRRAALEKYVASHPMLEDYARFRAVGDRRRAAWQAWSAPLRDGVITDADYDIDDKRYHEYVQWLADEQLQDLAHKARANGPGLYLDLPLGVNASSYDVWRERRAFAADVAAGAPPDPFFAKGQNWGFPPMHPERMREGGYPYIRAYLRHHLRLAGILRIDHMMGLHRLYWIPHGMEAKDGVYVGYRAAEQYAVFTLEAHRHGSVLVGEDLGTVPPEVPPMMARHHIHRMYVLQYQAQPKEDALSPIFPGAVASINTHDMPTFAAFWDGLDIDDRVDLGILTEEQAAAERIRRTTLCRSVEASLLRMGLLRDPSDRMAVLRACLEFLSRGPGRVSLANLEDFWLEKNPQNTPGTWRERPNWQRRAKYSLEELQKLPAVLEGLRAMDRAVRQGG